MAYSPYFTFSDPALQREVVNEAQVLAAAEAARQQQRAQTIAALRQERQQRADLEERRAIREGDIRRLEANEAERRRQFDVQTGLTEKDIASREKIAGVRNKDVDDRELYAGLLRLVEGDDPPTLKELEARMVGLSDERKQILRDRRNATAAAKKLQFTQSVNEANRLSKLIGTDRTDGKQGKWTADDVLNGPGKRWAGILQVTPDGLGFESLLRPPREDPLGNPSEGVFPQPSPGFVPRATDFPVTPMPGTGPSISEPISAVQSRLSGPMRQPGLLERYGRALLDFNIHPVARLANRFFVPPVGPEAAPSMRIPASPMEAQGPMGLAPRYAVPMDPMSDYLPGPFVPEY